MSDGRDSFRPLFVVGCQRSGTTALAVMFDRHSQIAVPSETSFFFKFAPLDQARRLPMTHEQLLSRACDDFFIRQAGIRFEDVIEVFRRYEPSYPNLFRSLLEAFAVKQGKRRVAEKTCDHLRYVPMLLRQFPESKVICIVRDGRDVVRSISQAWGNRPWHILSRQWNWYARMARRWVRTCPADRFTVVNYSDLILRPEEEMKRLCAFIGEQFEPSQLDSSIETNAVPKAELAWKGKAKEGPDPSRIDAWRRCEDRELIAMLNFYMGPSLRDWGFADTEVTGIPLSKRLQWWIRYLPCRVGVFPIASYISRVALEIKYILTGTDPRQAGI